MSTPLRHSVRLLVMLALVWSAQAQPAATTQADKAPPMPQLKAPVELFRELLAMNATAREQSLAQRPPEIRKRILEKLQEYEAMKLEDRELRLRATELRWYLLALMQMPMSDRASQLLLVPEADRLLVATSLAKWDGLPHEGQEAILKYERAMDAFVLQRVRGGSTANASAEMNSPLPQDPFKGIENFLKLPSEQRQKLYASFEKFFDLSAAERERTLTVLPPPQRLQMANALAFFGRLPKASREQFLNSFDKFSSLSEAERRDFLANAERWRELAPAQREAWRSLINQVPPMPPMPVGMAFPPQATLQANEAVKGR